MIILHLTLNQLTYLTGYTGFLEMFTPFIWWPVKPQNLP